MRLGLGRRYTLAFVDGGGGGGEGFRVSGLHHLLDGEYDSFSRVFTPPVMAARRDCRDLMGHELAMDRADCDDRQCVAKGKGDWMMRENGRV